MQLININPIIYDDVIIMTSQSFLSISQSHKGTQEYRYIANFVIPKIW